MDPSSNSERLWSGGFIYLLAVSIINYSAFGMISPLIPGYVVSLGATLSFAGVVAGVFSITALFVRPLASIMGDRLNKRYLLLASLTINGFAVILYAVVPGIMWMLPVRVLHGVMFSISGTLSFALGAEFIPKPRMGEGVGYLGIGQTVGMAVGPNIGLFLVEHYSYTLTFLLSGSIITAAGLAVFALRYRHTPYGAPKNSEKGAFHFRDLVAVELLPNALFVAIIAVGMGLTFSYLILLGNERGIGNIGLYFVLNAVVLLLVRPLLGRLADRKGVAYAILPGYVLMSVAMSLIGFSHSLWLILLAAVLAAGGGGALPAIQADCLRRLDSSRRTVATGTYFIGMDVGMTTGQMFGGAFTDAFGFTATYNSVAGLLLLGFILYLLYHKMEMRRHANSSK